MGPNHVSLHAITFLTDREEDIVSLSAPLEPMVKDIVFLRLAVDARERRVTNPFAVSAALGHSCPLQALVNASALRRILTVTDIGDRRRRATMD
jgi:hypothetical protein